MSTCETWDTEVGRCPCGQGTIVRTTHSPDNAWSKTSHEFSIACPACSAAWRVDGSHLVHIASEAPWQAAEAREQVTRAALWSVAQDIVGRHFRVLQLPTRKAELAELKRLGLSRDSYGTYTRARRERASVEACAMCLANLTWLKSRAEAYGLLEQLSLAHTANEAAKAAAQAAYALIQRRELGSPPATSCQPPT